MPQPLCTGGFPNVNTSRKFLSDAARRLDRHPQARQTCCPARPGRPTWTSRRFGAGASCSGCPWGRLTGVCDDSTMPRARRSVSSPRPFLRTSRRSRTHLLERARVDLAQRLGHLLLCLGHLHRILRNVALAPFIQPDAVPYGVSSTSLPTWSSPTLSEPLKRPFFPPMALMAAANLV